MILRIVSIFYILITFFVAGYVYAPWDERDTQFLDATVPNVVIEDTALNQPVRVVFVGDIMLGRNVETLIEKNGFLYPFQNVMSLLSSPDLTIGNFEGAVPLKHVHTPDFTFLFSIRNEYLEYLKDIGFDVLSLANNHSFDYGNDALDYTRTKCEGFGLLCGGSPNDIDEYSTRIQEIHGKKIGIIFIHAVVKEPETRVLEVTLNSLREKSDIQIAYVHWGEEYALTHNTFQEQLAHRLIDGGVDAVIGHHPHVIQDVAVYNGKPIFYSLGNFIFDQYFSTDVQEGLALSMEIIKDNIVYELIPFSSTSTHSQPNFMNSKDQKRIFARVLQNIKDDENVDTENGILNIVGTELE